MKYLITINTLIILSIITIGCDSINVSQENGNQILYLDGYIHPNTKVGEGTIELSFRRDEYVSTEKVVWNRGRIDSKGHFQLNVLPISDEYLKPVGSFYKQSLGGINISDTTAKLGRIMYFSIYCKDSTFYDAQVWSDSLLRTLRINFYYSTKDVIIQGRDSIYLGPQEIFVTEYKMDMKKGWNKVVTTLLPSRVTGEVHYSLFIDNQISSYWHVFDY